MGQQPLVSVVDDESVRESLPDLLRQCGFDARAPNVNHEDVRDVVVSRVVPSPLGSSAVATVDAVDEPRSSPSLDTEDRGRLRAR